MDEVIKRALVERLLGMADDELVLAHRNSEWIGHGPILEEDIALANLAQDELGHATVWYGLLAALTGDDPDKLVFFRDAEAFRCVRLVALPKGDWAVTMLRQYLFDAYEMALLSQLRESAYGPLRDAVQKIRVEELYHYRHSSIWVRRLGLGTAESGGRMRAALALLWPFVGQLFAPADGGLVAAGIWPDMGEVLAVWRGVVVPHLRESGLVVEEGWGDDGGVPAGRDHHTHHLAELVADLQKVARAHPDAKW